MTKTLGRFGFEEIPADWHRAKAIYARRLIVVIAAFVIPFIVGAVIVGLYALIKLVT